MLQLGKPGQTGRFPFSDFSENVVPEQVPRSPALAIPNNIFGHVKYWTVGIRQYFGRKSVWPTRPSWLYTFVVVSWGCFLGPPPFLSAKVLPATFLPDRSLSLPC